MNTHYNIEGTPNSPVLLFSNSLGTDLSMWDAVVPLLLPYFQIVRYDTRGAGKSAVTEEEYSIAQLGQDVIDLMDELGFEKVHFCGLSMGGQIGQWLGVNHSNRINKLILSNTGAHIGSSTAWNERIELIKNEGLSAIWEGTQNVWFTHPFIESQTKEMSRLQTMFLNNNVLGYANCCAAVRDADFRKELCKIKLETLVIAGSEDPATTLSDAEFIVKEIPNAQLQVIPGKHIPSIEQATQYAELIVDFLVGNTNFDKGMHVRRTVLGNAHVDRASQAKNDFNGDFQSFISHYAWGEIWTRPGLSKHNRSLITLSMMIALNRPAEFKMHVKAAINNGVTVDEIKEVILQSGIYCGLPAANDAYHSAQAVFKENNIPF